MLTPNSILQNRYQIIRLLGQGGMGAVYLAFDQRLNQHVALKENTGGDPRQFQQEAQLLARLRHPNLPRVGDHFIEPNGAQYLVMDYIAGEDLETLRQTRGALPEAQVRVWFDQILDAIAYLHSQGVIHRDIKPDNIKITPGGQAVLVDFGIAKVYQTGQFTRTGQKFGSPGYASPEHYRGGTNQQSDVYSLGSTLYAVLTGGAPPDAQALERGTAVLVTPRNVNPGISPQMELMILRAMRVKPNSPISSVAEMRQNLIALTPTMPISTPKPRTNQRLIAALGVGIVGVLILFGVGGWVLAGNKQSITQTPTRLVAQIRETFTPKVIKTATLILSVIATAVPSETQRPTHIKGLVPTVIPTREPTAMPSASPTRFSRFTTAPTLTISPTETAELVISTSTPTFQPLPPGLYVKEFSMTPKQPHNKETITFSVSFQTINQKLEKTNWIIGIHRINEDNEDRFLGVINGPPLDGPEPQLEHLIVTYSISGVRGCENFYARIYQEIYPTTGNYGARTVLPSGDGQETYLQFQVCS